MEVQSEISKELLREKVGKTIKVLVDEAPMKTVLRRQIYCRRSGY